MNNVACKCLLVDGGTDTGDGFDHVIKLVIIRFPAWITNLTWQ